MAPPKGTTNNPNGRPPKSRALTELLEKAGNKTIEVDGKHVARKRLLADMVWQIAMTGSVKIEGKTYKEPIGSVSWFEVVKFLYRHIDGDPKTSVELSGDKDNPLTYENVGENARELLISRVAGIGARISQERGTGEPEQ